MPITQSYSETLLNAIIRSICRRSKNPSIQWSDSFNYWIISNLDDRDQGRLIGKGGATFYALETVMWYAGIAHAQAPESVHLPSRDKATTTPPRSPFKPNPRWDRLALGNLTDTITQSCTGKKVPWIMLDTGKSEATISIELAGYLKAAMAEPDFDLALRTILHSAAMSDGASVTVNILWK